MKLKKFAVLLVCVMVLGLCGSAFAEYRTGSDVGDAVLYGAAGVGIGATSSVVTASVAASWIAGAVMFACPPVAVIGVAAGTGALIYGGYGYYVPNKTLKKDLLFAGVTAIATPIAAKYVTAEQIFSAGKSVMCGVGMKQLEEYKNNGEKVDLRNPAKTNVADWAY